MNINIKPKGTWMKKSLLIMLLLSCQIVVADPFDYKVTFDNGSDSQKVKITEALELAHNQMKTDEFKQAVIGYIRPDGTVGYYQTDKTPEQVYETLQKGTWDYKIRFYNKCLSTANAYVVADDPTININWCKTQNRSIQSIANTLVHEHTHKFNFIHDYNDTPNRPYTVPYAVGLIIEKQTGGKVLAQRPFYPWYKRILNWFKL